jgi:hypothetical protein
MRTFYVRNSDDNQRLRIYLFLFAEYDGEAEDGRLRTSAQLNMRRRSRSTQDAKRCAGVDRSRLRGDGSELFFNGCRGSLYDERIRFLRTK